MKTTPGVTRCIIQPIALHPPPNLQTNQVVHALTWLSPLFILAVVIIIVCYWFYGYVDLPVTVLSVRLSPAMIPLIPRLRHHWFRSRVP